MTIADSVHNLQTLLLAFQSVIVFETVEEERVQKLLQTAVQDMQLPLYEWSITRGLVRSAGPNNRWVDECTPPGSHQPAAFERTVDPVDMLEHIGKMTQRGVFWLKDFARHLTDPVVARQFREIAQLFGQSRSALVLSGHTIALPPRSCPGCRLL
ncbi:hypothetical protein [Leptodesmis sp.]|uniref:hypothetical protein n=1 Tax=Leptodesmis sp. TaxID=3100501 RepID=UPI00405354FE